MGEWCAHAIDKRRPLCHVMTYDTEELPWNDIIEWTQQRFCSDNADRLFWTVVGIDSTLGQEFQKTHTHTCDSVTARPQRKVRCKTTLSCTKEKHQTTKIVIWCSAWPDVSVICWSTIWKTQDQITCSDKYLSPWIHPDSRCSLAHIRNHYTYFRHLQNIEDRVAGDFSKDCVFAVQMLALIQRNKKLGTVVIGSTIGHSYLATMWKLKALVKFIFECAPVNGLATLSTSGWVSSLHHEILDNAVENGSIEVALLAQLDKISARLISTTCDIC